MKRRDFFKTASILYLSNQNLLANESVKGNFLESFFTNLFDIKEDTNTKKVILKDTKENSLTVKEIQVFEEGELTEDKTLIIESPKKVEIKKEQIKTAKIKEEKTAKIIKKDLFIEEKYLDDFFSVRNKLTEVQRYVGYGNFNIISFDEVLRIGRNVNKVGAFSKSELEFLESIFYYDPSIHGFYGEKISKEITDTINKKEVVKIPHTGHYLFKGHSEDTYYKMVDDIGESIVLTSGIRSIMKQTKLFLDKLHSVDGNFTVASKSLAPPAFTYHTIADFDVGKKGLGVDNFTSRFALTQEFSAMRKLRYIDMRYTINNKDGVRYEPWHVKVI